MKSGSAQPVGDEKADLVSGLQLPLMNMETTIQMYLLANGARLDPETRLLLAGVRDGLSKVLTRSKSFDHDAALSEAREKLGSDQGAHRLEAHRLDAPHLDAHCLSATATLSEQEVA